jgi:6-phosphogluconolactonase (cycloisomerase 2 family)
MCDDGVTQKKGSKDLKHMDINLLTRNIVLLRELNETKSITFLEWSVAKKFTFSLYQSNTAGGGIATIYYCHFER